MSLIKTGQGVTDIRGGFSGVYFTRDKSGLHCTAKPRRVRQLSAGQKAQRDAFSAARALSKDNRVVSYLMYRHMNSLPIKPHWQASGTPVPNCKGTYVFGGTYHEKDYYRLGDKWFVWWDTEDLEWTISPGLGILIPGSWGKVGDPVAGTYTADPGYSGTVIFSYVTYPVPIDYQIPKL